RFTKDSRQTKGDPIIYATNENGDINTGVFQAERFIGSLEALEDNAYARCNTSLRVTDKRGFNNGNPFYRDVQARNYYSEGGYIYGKDGVYLRMEADSQGAVFQSPTV